MTIKDFTLTDDEVRYAIETKDVSVIQGKIEKLNLVNTKLSLEVSKGKREKFTLTEIVVSTERIFSTDELHIKMLCDEEFEGESGVVFGIKYSFLFRVYSITEDGVTSKEYINPF